MSKRPLVSVVIRTYNRGTRLHRAIDSALAQTFEDFEVLVVDDASEDGSAGSVRHRYGHEARIRLIEHTRNRGAAAAANTGVEHANGRYVAFLDSDDTWLPEFLNCHVGALRGQPAAVASYCDFLRYWGEYAMVRPATCESPSNQRKAMLTGGFIHSQSMTMLLREVIIHLGGFDEQLVISHDFDLWLRLALEIEQPFVHVQRPLVRYAMSTDAVTARFERWHEEFRAVVDRGFAHPAAAPYRTLHGEAVHKVALAIIARKESMRWIHEPHQASVSVVMTTRNARAFVADTLAGVQTQGYPCSELIVVDDASEDGTADWILEQEIDDAKVIRLARRQGTPAALNHGLMIASGELIAFLDHDDCWEAGYLESHVRAHSLVWRPPAYSYCDYMLEREDAEPEAVAHEAAGASSDLLLHALYNVLPHTLSAMVADRSALLAVGGVDESLPLGFDVSLQLRLLGFELDKGLPAAQTHPPVRICRPLVRWRRHGARAMRRAMRDQYLAVAHRVYSEFLDSRFGVRYRFLRRDLERDFARRMLAAYEHDFGIPADAPR